MDKFAGEITTRNQRHADTSTAKLQKKKEKNGNLAMSRHIRMLSAVSSYCLSYLFAFDPVTKTPLVVKRTIIFATILQCVHILTAI